MGQKRAIFGTLRLWSHARTLDVTEDRGNPPQVALGVDQDRALVIPDSPNVAGGFEVVTWGGPVATKTQAAWISQKAAIRAAVRARHRFGAPLVWVDDDAFDAEIASGSGTSYQTAAAHDFAAGDWLYLYRPTDGIAEADLKAYGWARVASIPPGPGTGIELETDPSTDDFAPEAGDVVVRVAALFTPLYIGAPQFSRPARGDYYSPEVRWAFHGVPTTEIHRVEGSVVP